jgi:hypothetical protein
VVVCACGLAACACGVQLPFLGAPTARDVLARPSRASMRDAHFTVSGASTAGVRVAGAGDIVFKPRLAVHLTETSSAGSTPSTVEIIAVDGLVYQRFPSTRWARVPASVQPAALSAWSSGAAPRYLGEETVDGARCWHVTASYGSSRLDLWVRESDGYPIRARVGDLAIDYDRFNSGVRIAPPPAEDVEPLPKNLVARVGEVAHLDGVDVTVAGVDLAYQPATGAPRPRAGDRLVVAEVAYLLTGSSRAAYAPAQWRLSDSRGSAYAPLPSGREPRLASGALTAPGGAAHGFVTFEVPAAATGLVLSGTIGQDTVSVALG